MHAQCHACGPGTGAEIRNHLCPLAIPKQIEQEKGNQFLSQRGEHTVMYREEVGVINGSLGVFNLIWLFPERREQGKGTPGRGSPLGNSGDIKQHVGDFHSPLLGKSR